jgi:hypothetical protein
VTTFDYAKMETLADVLLTKFGQSMTLTSETKGGEYDTHSGTSYTSTATSTVIGVILPTSTSRVRGSEGALTDFDNASLGLADSKRRFAILKAKDSTLPQVADKITDAGGDSWRVTGVTQVSPAGTDIIWRVGLEAA